MQRNPVNLVLCAALLSMVATACSPPAAASRPPRVEEITFRSGSFKLVGDLRTPGGPGPYPVVLFVHGSGPTDRTGMANYLPVMERMLQAGYATFAWDKPGTGESTGTLDERRLQAQRAQILLDAIAVIKARPDVDPKAIGLWGASQAGYVMPRVLAQSTDVAFMICISCAGMSSYDQMAFQTTALALCDGVPADRAEEKARLLAELDTARTYGTYDEYVHYREALRSLADLVSAPVEKWPVLSAGDWQKNDPASEPLWNPMPAVEGAAIPVLAIFGDRDCRIDPLQGAHAYRLALEKAGDSRSRVAVFARANHGIVASETGCPAEDDATFLRYIQSLGYESVSEALQAVLQDPYKPGQMGDPPFAPGFLDTLGEWLGNLRE